MSRDTDKAHLLAMIAGQVDWSDLRVFDRAERIADEWDDCGDSEMERLIDEAADASVRGAVALLAADFGMPVGEKPDPVSEVAALRAIQKAKRPD